MFWIIYFYTAGTTIGTVRLGRSARVRTFTLAVMVMLSTGLMMMMMMMHDDA